MPMKDKRKTIKASNVAKLCIGVIFLVIGCLIYLLFRSKSLYIYVWCKSLGISAPIDTLRLLVHDWSIPDYVRFCLPDGLYCAAYLFIVDVIWHEDKRRQKFFIYAVIPIISIGSEVLQYFGVIKGTYDVLDFVFYIVPSLLFFSIDYIIPKLFIKQIT